MSFCQSNNSILIFLITDEKTKNSKVVIYDWEKKMKILA